MRKLSTCASAFGAVAAAITIVAAPRAVFAADSSSLYGVHWWGIDPDGSTADDGGAAAMLNAPAQGGYDLEIANTNNEFFWSAQWLRPTYQDLYANHNVTPITRIDYAWGETVPGYENPDQATWKNSVVSAVNTLHDYAHLWQLGNEPNLNGEANHWGPSQQITPAGYAALYQDVRGAVQSQAQVGAPGAHKLLIAPASPGDVIAGTRWISGNDWLAQTIDAFGANKSAIDGFALHSYGGGDSQQSLTGFRSALAQQIAIIDSRGLTNVPLYITEFNRNTDTANTADEAASAQFVHDAYKFLNDWNSRPGNHNVVTATWFVYDGDTTGAGWPSYSVEYWKTRGYPLGDSRDLYTGFQQTVQQNYKAGISGTRPMPAGVQIIDDFESNAPRRMAISSGRPRSRRRPPARPPARSRSRRLTIPSRTRSRRRSASSTIPATLTAGTCATSRAPACRARTRRSQSAPPRTARSAFTCACSQTPARRTT